MKPRLLISNESFDLLVSRVSNITKKARAPSKAPSIRHDQLRAAWVGNNEP